MRNISELAQVYAQLSESFPKEAVQHVSARAKGYEMTGYKYQYVADRFNEVCGIDGWRFSPNVFEINKLEKDGHTDGFEVIVRTQIDIKLSGEDGKDCISITREGYGGHQSKYLADAIKGAQTDSFKKTAAFFGVGADAYRQAIDNDYLPDRETAAITDRTPVPYGVGEMVLDFGKHAGKKLCDILVEDRNYIEWLKENSYTEDVRDACRELLNTNQESAPLSKQEIIDALGAEIPQ